MTNMSRHRLGNTREQNHSIRRCDCDTALLHGHPPSGPGGQFFDAGHTCASFPWRWSPPCCLRRRTYRPVRRSR